MTTTHPVDERQPEMTNKLNAEELLEDMHKLLVQNARLIEKLEQRDARIAELQAARTAYASEFPLDDDGEPDVGNIHANIRKLKAQLAALQSSAPVERVSDEREILARLAELRWNKLADQHNQWAALGLDEKDDLIEQLSAALSAQPNTAEPDLYEAEKLAPYEMRYFRAKGMAEKLGYQVLAEYRRVAPAEAKEKA